MLVFNKDFGLGTMNDQGGGSTGGDVITATNNTGSAITAGDKVWVEYTAPVSNRDDNIGTGYVYNNENDGKLYIDPSGSKVARNNSSSNTCQIYDITLGNAPVAGSTFQMTYQGSSWRFFEGDYLYQLNKTNLTNSYVKFSSSGAQVISGTGKYYIGAGLYSTGTSAYDENDNLVYTISGAGSNTRMNNAYQIDSSHIIIIYTADYTYPNNIAKVDIVNGVGTQSGNINMYSGAGKYGTRLGFTSDGKYYICDPNRIIKVSSWSRLSLPNTFSSWDSNYVSYFNNIGNIITFKCTDGYIRSYKYNPDDETWSEITSIAVQTNGVVGVSNSTGTILLYMSSAGSSGNASVNVKQASTGELGWYALPFTSISQDALTGVAKENIASGSTGQFETILGE